MSYAYAAAAWGGGPIFVLNMVGVHALMLVGLGRPRMALPGVA